MRLYSVARGGLCRRRLVKRISGILVAFPLLWAMVVLATLWHYSSLRGLSWHRVLRLLTRHGALLMMWSNCGWLLQKPVVKSGCRTGLYQISKSLPRLQLEVSSNFENALQPQVGMQKHYWQTTWRHRIRSRAVLRSIVRRRSVYRRRVRKLVIVVPLNTLIEDLIWSVSFHEAQKECLKNEFARATVNSTSFEA